MGISEGGRRREERAGGIVCWGAVCVCIECIVLLFLRLYSSSDSDPPSDINLGSSGREPTVLGPLSDWKVF